MRGEVRRKELEISEKEALNIIKEAEHGVLATVNAEGIPCVVAMNHVLLDDALYFHCGPKGEKLDNIKLNPAVSFLVTGVADVVYEQFTTAYSSAVVHGTAHIVDEPEEKLRALTALVKRYSSDVIPQDVVSNFIEIGVDVVVIFKIIPTNITGKARLSRNRPCLRY